MKKNLLITLADRNYLDQAKQLFSSVYFNAGWQGDYMLLAYDAPEEDLGWFKNKGILIKHCQPIYQREVGHRPPVFSAKFNLFIPELKKWDNVVYLDSDMIVKASLDELAKVKGLSAVTDENRYKFFTQFLNSRQLNKEQLGLLKQTKEKYNLRSTFFNSGILAFNTDIIEQDTFDNLNKLMEKYKDIIWNGDQTILNLYFFKKWESLPSVYNVYITGSRNLWHLKLEKIKGIVLHFISTDQLWINKNYFYQEWKDNLDKANEIDLGNIPTGKKWSPKQISDYSNYLNFRYNLFVPYFYIDRKIGQFGLLLKKYFPAIYRFLGGIK